MSATRQQERQRNLEQEADRLRRRLSYVQSQTPTLGRDSREQALQDQLDDVQIEMERIAAENSELEHTVEELHMRLTLLDTEGLHIKSGSFDSSKRNISKLERGMREKRLEVQLEKAKRDKEKAVRLIVEMVGKDVIDQFLRQHVGSTDVLDKLADLVRSGSVTFSEG